MSYLLFPEVTGKIPGVAKCLWTKHLSVFFRSSGTQHLEHTLIEFRDTFGGGGIGRAVSISILQLPTNNSNTSRWIADGRQRFAGQIRDAFVGARALFVRV